MRVADIFSILCATGAKSHLGNGQDLMPIPGGQLEISVITGNLSHLSLISRLAWKYMLEKEAGMTLICWK